MPRARIELDDLHDLDLYFSESSNAWMQNKNEVIERPGSGGSFSYVS